MATISDDLAQAIARRKREHIEQALYPRSVAPAGARWEDVHLVHDSLPAVDAADVDLTTEFLGRELRLPLVIAGMTGGHEAGLEINRRLARAAQHAGVAMGLGSQRAMLRDPTLAPTYTVAREAAPDAMLIGNLGVAQLIDQDGDPALTPDEVDAAIAAVGADALAVHLNYVEESVQPEGQTRALGAADALQRLAQRVAVPVIAKETGGGISRAVAERLRACGVQAVDVGGLGGTSFATIEAGRAAERGDVRRAALGEALGSWGTPTPVAVAACAGVLPVVATGGVRNGIDAAKAIALGASAVGVGRSLLQPALQSEQAVLDWIEEFELQLRTAVFLTGGRQLAELRRAPRVVLGETRGWLEQIDHASGATTR